MRGRIGTKEETCIPRCGRSPQGQAVFFTLGHRQTIIMRVNAPDQNRIAIDDQMMRGDGCRKIGVVRRYKINTVLGGDVLHNNAQFRQALAQRSQNAINEHRFAVENINIGIGNFAVHT